MEFSAKQIAEYIQGIIVGDENATVHTFAKIEEGVPGNVKSNEQILGTPAIDAKNFMKSSAVYKKLPEMYATLNAMQKEIEELKKQLNK